ILSSAAFLLTILGNLAFKKARKLNAHPAYVQVFNAVGNAACSICTTVWARPGSIERKFGCYTAQHNFRLARNAQTFFTQKTMIFQVTCLNPTIAVTVSN